MNGLILVMCLLAGAGCTISMGPNRGEELRREFQARDERATAERAAARVDQTATWSDGVTATATVNYWRGLKAALQPQPNNPDSVARQIDHLPTLGVDPELVRQTQIVVEKMRTPSATAHSLSDSGWFSLFRWSTHARLDAELKDLVAQCRAIEKMRPE